MLQFENCDLIKNYKTGNSSNVTLEIVMRYNVSVQHIACLLCHIIFKIFFQLVVLPTSCFDSKQKFVNALRQAFQGGTFSLFNSCTNKDVIEYYQYLKRDFEAGDEQYCCRMVHVGLQQDGYWCSSEEVCHNLQSYVAIFKHGLQKTCKVLGTILQ